MDGLRTIVLAAGKGTRMKSDVPKVLHQVGGQALIDYVLNVVKDVGSLKTYVVLGYGISQVKNHLGNRVRVVQQKKMLGTADAVKVVLNHLKGFSGDVLILCGDTPLLRHETIRRLIAHHRRSKAACTVLTAIVKDARGYGRIIRNTRGLVTAIREEKDASDAEKDIHEINVGMYCFSATKLLSFVPKIKINPVKKEYYLTDIIGLLAGAHFKIETITTDDAQEGLGVNTREDLALAQAVVRKRILKKLMQQGVTILDPSTTYIDARVKIGRDTVIKPFVFIEENVTIGKRCKIGPFARLRPGTKIADEAEVGNFTEISRTRLGRKSIMKHFSFLGDAIIGEKVNIGAGTVTANYDGVSKNQTNIGNGAFIGSDAVLVAPVKIGKKAMVGAGSVVTKGKIIPDGGIAVGIPARVIKRRKI